MYKLHWSGELLAVLRSGLFMSGNFYQGRGGLRGLGALIRSTRDWKRGSAGADCGG